MESTLHDALRDEIHLRAKSFERTREREESVDDTVEKYLLVLSRWLHQLNDRDSQVRIWNDYVFQPVPGIRKRVIRIDRMMHILFQQRVYEAPFACKVCGGTGCNWCCPAKCRLSIRCKGNPMNKEYIITRAEHERHQQRL